MGPRLFSRGNRAFERGLTWLEVLQWGRDSSVAEMRQLLQQQKPVRGLQWGRDSSVAEIDMEKRARKFSACFNGAATLQSRKSGARYAPTPAAWLQWGRDSSVAEMLRPAPVETGALRSFNGAATLQSRKW